MEEIARISRIPRGTLNKLFSGQTRDPQLSTIRAVVSALGYTLNDLYHAGSSAEERELLRNFRALDAHGKDMVQTVLQKECLHATAQREQNISAAAFGEYGISMAARKGKDITPDEAETIKRGLERFEKSFRNDPDEK